MFRKLFITTLLFVIFSIGLYKVADNFDTFFANDNTSLDQTGVIDDQKEEPLTQKEINKQIVAEKIAKLKNRYAQRGLILTGDDHLQNNEYTEALQLYLSALSKSPNDEEIIKKVADTYFAMKRFDAAYKKYQDIIDYSQVDKHNAWLSLLYSKPYEYSASGSYMNAINSLELDPQDNFYYTTMLSCVDDFHECKKTYQQYLDTHSGALSNRMNSLSGAIVSYEAFQTEQLYFKDTLIVKSFFDDGNYPIVIELGEQILESQPGYTPVQKMIAQSYFELGEIEKTETILQEIYEEDTSDGEVAYILGLLYSQQEDYVRSNILLNKALENNYTPEIYARRILINNYIDLDQSDKVLDEFKNLLGDESGDITRDDLLLASYYNILYDNLLEAARIADTGIEQFPESADFYGFAGWIAKEELDTLKALEYLQKGYEIDPKNSMISLNIAQVYLLQKDKKQAIFYLKQTTKNDPDGQFGSIAQELLDEL